MAVAALALIALALAGPLPRIMAQQNRFREAPRPALVVWQAVSLSAVLAALLAAPIGIRLLARPGEGLTDHLWAAILAVAVTGTMLARLLLSGHRVGTRLRTVRRRHRELVDVLATHGEDELRVLEHPTATAYCLPGLRQRVVLTQGTMDRLPADELAAVLAHERAHLRARHDLILEFFTVVHVAVPGRLRCHAALREVRLLVEVLADRSAARAVGELPMARALVALAGGDHPEATLGAARSPSTARVRLELLSATRRNRVALSVVMFGFALVVLAAPVLIAVLGWAG